MTTRLQLVLLLIAAMACVATLLASVVGRHRVQPGELDMSHVALIALVAGAAFLAGLVVWHMSGVARREARAAKARKPAAPPQPRRADAIIRAEPQVLIFWEQGHAVRIVSHTLSGVPGLPEHNAEILRFGQWLEAGSAQSLKTALDTLSSTAAPSASS